MYELAVSREFEAVHFLVGGDWGQENLPHTHYYKVEVLLSGKTLDRFGYLVDITDIEGAMDETVRTFDGMTLNDLSTFAGINPSIEHFCRIWCRALLKRFDPSRLQSIRVRIWESGIAWAAYSEQLS
jgi:6-pyruvoyltetrahydropterin/6-carboxytetrahydropterin synthase